MKPSAIRAKESGNRSRDSICVILYSEFHSEARNTSLLDISEVLMVPLAMFKCYRLSLSEEQFVYTSATLALERSF